MPDRDVVALYSECNSDFQGEPLVRPVIIAGELVEPAPSTAQIRSHALSAVAALPARLRSLDPAAPYQVQISPRLLALAEGIRNEHQLVRS